MIREPLNVLELFAGVSGIGLGLETQGWRTVAFSDFDQKLKRQYAAEVMQLRHPDAASLGDIRALTFARNHEGMASILRQELIGAPDNGQDVHTEELYKGSIDIIAGGFPCQNVSTAGKGGGVRDGDRSGLWHDFARAIEGLQPRGVLIENVAALTGRGLDIVLQDLARLGYDCEWDVISAAGVGAPHLRERIFIIAWKAGTAAHAPWPAPPLYDSWMTEPEGVPRLVTHDVEQRVARLRCLGNAVVPQCAAHVAGILAERLDQSWRIDGGTLEHDHPADDKHARGSSMGDLKWWGTTFRVDALEATPGYAGWIDMQKLPRAGRMTAGIVVQRVRTCEQRFAKARALKHMAATLRPRVDDHPELPRVRLVPTPSASLPNDGEGADTWIDRKVAHAEKGDASTRASMPLAIYAQVKDALVPTPTVADATGGPGGGAAMQGGESLRTYVAGEGDGNLLPTQRCCAGLRSSGLNRTEMMEALDLTAGSLVPTAPPELSDGNLLPTVTSSEHKYRIKGDSQQSRSLGGMAARGGLAPEKAGRLNPEWVEYLMGFQPGWTDLAVHDL